MSEINRLYSYASLLSSRRALPRDEILHRLEISKATFKRDLTKLRDRLNMPVVFDKEMGGYRFERDDAHTELPGLWFTHEEILALLTIQNMIGQLEPGMLGPKLKPLQARLNEMLHARGMDATLLAQRIKLLHAGKRRLPLKAFQAVAQATLGRQRLRITHFNRQSGEHVEREISPQQLVCYRDNWYVDAWCHLREGLRNFAVDAITEAHVLTHAAREVPLADIEAEMTHSYGIFGGQPVQWARLKFTPERARWVSREEWHPEQKVSTEADGSYVLELPYSDARELMGDILRHGAEVQVLAPQSLRTQVQEAMRAALKRYESYL